MNKYKLFMIISVIILILSLGGTYSWYVWQSGEEDTTNVVAGIEGVYITYDAGNDIFGEKIRPVGDKSQGIVKNITVKTNVDSLVDVTLNLYLDINVLDPGLKHESFKYAVYDGNGNHISSGDFTEALIECTTNNTNHIVLVSNAVVNQNVSKYTLYIWLDGNMDNPTSMQNENFSFTLHADGLNAIYKSNVIQNEEVKATSSSSTFLNTSLKRSEIQSITIADNNIVPDNAKDTSQDISAMQNGSVMLWYTKDTTTNLYDVYIGSETGIVESNTSGEGLFSYLENVETLDLTNFDTSNMNTMEKMFNYSSGLKTVDVSNFDTSNVISMYAMFQWCEELTNLDVSKWDTSNVMDMTGLFNKCMKLTSLDVSKWDTSKVTSMYALFRTCISLLELNLSNWDTSNVTNMRGFFQSNAEYGVMSLKTIGDVGGWDTSKVTDFSAMFQFCSNLQALDVSKWDTSNVTAMQTMFSKCSKLSGLDVSNWDVSNVINMAGLFVNCENLVSLDLSSWDTSDVTDMLEMFYGCTNLKTIYVGNNWTTAAVTDSTNMFYNCTALVGGTGTTYNASFVDKTYARVDGGISSPGYFTYKAASV